MSDITRILSSIEQGDPHGAEQLLPLVYCELRKLANQKMAQETPGQTLQATALVHEAYIRLVDVEKVQHWDNRGHFFVAAAAAMQRILVENARRKRSPKAGGEYRRVKLSAVDPEAPERPLDSLALSEAIDKLAVKNPRAAELVKLRYFVGLTNEEAAKTLGISASTASKDWTYAKCWLRAEMTGSPPAR
jgi:RNA polymerase sigma factor (TIGR02999 family)